MCAIDLKWQHNHLLQIIATKTNINLSLSGRNALFASEQYLLGKFDREKFHLRNIFEVNKKSGKYFEVMWASRSKNNNHTSTEKVARNQEKCDCINYLVSTKLKLVHTVHRVIVKSVISNILVVP